jgi:hypothetical protein
MDIHHRRWLMSLNTIFGIPYLRDPALFTASGGIGPDLWALIIFVTIIVVFMAGVVNFSGRRVSDFSVTLVIVALVAAVMGLIALVAPGYVIMLYIVFMVSLLLYKVIYGIRNGGKKSP